MQPGLFDLEFRLDKIDANGDPLKKLNDLVDWEIFRPDLEAVRDKERKSPAGRKPYDAVLMFKILILQSLYGLSDDTTEYQILDRLKGGMENKPLMNPLNTRKSPLPRRPQGQFHCFQPSPASQNRR